MIDYKKLKSCLEEYKKELEIIGESCIVYSGTSKYIEGSKNPAIDCRHPAAQPFIEDLRKSFGPFSGLKECESGIHTIVEHSKRMREKYTKIEEIINDYPLVLSEEEQEILKERLVCGDECKYFADLLDKKFKILENFILRIQNHLDKEL